LFVQKGFENVSLSDIAEQTGSAKSNLYRYFESREHIYLVMLQNEGEVWEKKVLATLKQLGGKGTASEVSEIITSSFMRADRYCVLISVLNSVLEKNLSPELVADFRSVFFDRRQRFAEGVAAALPKSSVQRISRITLPIFAHVAGLWPLSHPAKNCKVVLEQARNRHLNVKFKDEMMFFVETMLTGALLPATVRSHDV
jgi:AcrR family transcriptional regulator